MDRYPPEAVLKAAPGMMHLAPGEFIILCPYNKTHRVLNKRFSMHVVNCRRWYKLKKLEAGSPPIMLSCKYDHGHKIIAPELHYHECSCPSKCNLFMDYLLEEAKRDINQRDAGSSSVLLREILYAEVGRHKSDPPTFLHGLKLLSETETGTMKQILGRLKPRVVVPAYLENKRLTDLVTSYTHRSPEKVIKQVIPDPDTALREGTSFMHTARRTDDDWCATRPLRPGVRDMIASLNLETPIRPRETSPQDSEEEYWSTANDTREPSNYFTNFSKLAKPVPKYPPWLTKGERKQFVEYNTQRMERERGAMPDTLDEWEINGVL